MERRRAPGCLRQQGQFTALRRARVQRGRTSSSSSCWCLGCSVVPVLGVQGEDEDATEPIGHQAVGKRERHVASSRPEHLEQGRWIARGTWGRTGADPGHTAIQDVRSRSGRLFAGSGSWSDARPSPRLARRQLPRRSAPGWIRRSMSPETLGSSKPVPLQRRAL